MKAFLAERACVVDLAPALDTVKVKPVLARIKLHRILIIEDSKTNRTSIAGLIHVGALQTKDCVCDFRVAFPLDIDCSCVFELSHRIDSIPRTLR